MRIHRPFGALLGLACILSTSLWADIYPRPQLCELGTETTAITSVNYIKLKQGDTILTNYTPLDEGDVGSLLDRKPDEGFILPFVAGAYAIFITENALLVYSYDEAGRYYAKQSLSQIIEDLEGKEKKEQKNALRDPYPESFNEALGRSASLPLGRIIDWPDLEQRGLLEDITTPNSSNWTHEERLEQIRFLGRNKLNSYFILDEAPPYSEEKMQKIKELYTLAKENHVRIVHGLQGESADLLCAQLVELYELGLRDFALQIGLDEASRPSAEAHHDLCQALMSGFFDQHEEAAPLQLIFYSADGKVELGKDIPKEWLAAMAKNTPQNLGLLWAVPAVMGQEAQAELVSVLGRAPVVMWMPDAAQVELQALPEGKLKEQAVHEGKIAGLLTQQVRHGDSKDIRLFTLADYCWNVADYKSERSKDEADKRLEPEAE